LTIPPVPLPEFRSLLSAASGRLQADWLLGRRSAQGSLLLYGRGSFALAGAVKAVRTKHRAAPTVWLPAYFCDEASDPLRSDGVEIRYYELTRRLEPDWERLESEFRNPGGLPILVLVHYFGFPSDTAAALDFCRRKNAILVEDAAHAAAPGASIGLAPFTVFSPRKLFAIPPIGCLVVADPQDAPPQPMTTGGGPAMVWLAKRIAQKAMRALHIPWHTIGRGFAAETAPRNSREPSPTPEDRGCDAMAARFLGLASNDASEVISQRRSNYEALARHILDSEVARPLVESLGAACPYALPVVFPGDVTVLARRLQERGIPVSRWPDLPTEVAGRSREFPVSNELYERILLLPIHQRLTSNDIERVATAMRKMARMP
jgi:hypothetical protein